MRHLFSVLFFSWLSALLILTYWPDLPDVKIRIREGWFRTDYLGHASFYAVLVVLFLLWQKGRKGTVNKRFIFIVGISGIALGALTEWTQSFIPGRSVNPLDLMYNCLGIVAGVIIFLFFMNRTRMTRRMKFDQ